MTEQLHAIAAVDGEAIAAKPEAAHRVSRMAAGLVGSEILRIAAEIRAMRAAGADVCNLTVGDFDPRQFPIPRALEGAIERALRAGETNYPPSTGVPELREAVREFYASWLGLEYPLGGILVTSGSRPGIYATFRTLVDEGDRVVYPVPSWNNNHYVHLVGAAGVPVPCGSETAFLPTAALLADAVRGARLLALNSPLNPTGTLFDEETLAGICDLVLEENARRSRRERPLYLMYDQVYWMLTFGGRAHVDPVTLRPAMRDYTIYIDGVSKAFAGTGLRVGWVVGPDDVVAPMSGLVGHVGAWAPRAEQLATAAWLGMRAEVEAFQREMVGGLERRLTMLHDGLAALRDAGHPVELCPPMGALYLSVRIDVAGRRARGDGARLTTNADIREWLLREAGVAAVPFQAFGATADDGWFRMSVGAVSPGEIERMLPRLRGAMGGLGQA
jgi:aspartate aminotransferase